MRQGQDALVWPVLWNPSAGFWRRYPIAKETIQELATEQGLRLEIHETHTLAEAQNFLTTFCAKKGKRLIVAGGDGTVRFALQAVAGQGVQVGIIPTGTANNVARSLAIPFQPTVALENIKKGNFQAISLGKANGAFFVEAAGVGFPADLLLRYYCSAGRRKEPWTFARLLWRFLRRWRPQVISLTQDGKARKQRITACIIANAPYFATAIPVAPSLALAHSAFQVMIIGELTFWERVGYLVAFLLGRHERLAKVQKNTADALILDADKPLTVHADDQIIGTTPVTFENVAAAVSIAVPKRSKNK